MFNNKFLLQILMIGGLFFCAASEISAQKIAADKDILAKYEKSIEQGNYELIERELLNYAIANPNDAKGFELLGKLRFAQNRLNEAKSLYQKSLSLDPHSAAAKINLAVINFQIGNGAQTLSDLDNIGENDISNDHLRLNLAQAYALAGDCRKAFNQIEKLDLKTKNTDALPVRAECYFKSNERQKISLLIPAAKNLAKQNPSAAIKFAEILSGGEMYREAGEVLRPVVADAPPKADALILLAKAEIQTKDTANAKIHLTQASKIAPNSPELLFAEGLLETAQGNSAKGLELMENSLAANPTSTGNLSGYVVAAIRANQSGKAFRAAENLLEIKPDEPEFLYLDGAAALQNKNFPAAESSLNRFIELRPNDSRGCLFLGLTLAAQPDKLENARQQLKHCVEIDANNYEANYQLGLSYKAAGDTAQAIEFLEAAVGKSPNYATALRELGALYLQTDAEVKARVVLEKAVSIDPNDADTHFQLSRLYNLLGLKDLAKTHLDIFQKLKNPAKSGM